MIKILSKFYLKLSNLIDKYGVFVGFALVAISFALIVFVSYSSRKNGEDFNVPVAIAGFIAFAIFGFILPYFLNKINKDKNLQQ